MKSVKLLAVAGFILAGSLGVLAQVNPDLEQGVKPYGSYHGGSLDRINIQNGNLFFQAGLLSYSQRGGELAYPIVLRYNNENFTLYQPPCVAGTKPAQCPQYVFFGPSWEATDTSVGNAVTVGFDGFPGGTSTSINTGLSYNGQPIYVDASSVLTQDGSLHQLVNANSGVLVTDGSGFYAANAGPLLGRNGTKYSSNVEDRNGNQFTISSAGTWTDTLGRQIPPMPGPAHPGDNPPASTASLGACPALGYANQPVTFAYTWNLPTMGGGSLPLILCYASVYVRSNFFHGVNPTFFHEVSQSFTMLQSVVLPDSTYWAFEYDAADPNNSASIALADLLKVTLPTGGTLAYTWGASGICGTGFGRGVHTRTVDANDGTGPHTWTYGNGATVTDPAGNDMVVTFTQLGAACTPYETQTQYYQGSHISGTLLKTVNTDYQFTPNPWDPAEIAGGTPKSVTNVFPIRVTTTLPNGLVSKVETDYDTALAYHGPLDGITYNVCTTDPDGMTTCTGGTYGVSNYTGSLGKVIAVREYDWGQGAPGPLLRQTKTTYQWQINSAYLNANLLDLPASVQVLDGAGNQVALTTYGYDEYALNSSGVTTQHNSNPVNGSVRGNLTSVHRWLNGSTFSTASCPIAVSNSFLVGYTQYNDTGTVNKSTDACGNAAGDPNHTTTHTYDPAYAGAYPTQTCNALNQCVSAAYDFSTGLTTSFTDQNQQTSNFSYDLQWRITQALGPTDQVTGLRPETDFDQSVVKQVKRSKKQDGSHWVVDYAYFDGVGRPKQARLVDPAGDDFVDTSNDALGRVSTVSNPHRSTSSPTDGITSTIYDALGRTTQVTHPDGTYVTTSYAGRAVQVSDEGNGTRSVERISQIDGLGRLASVCEISSGTLMGTGGTPAACGQDIAGTGFLTTYTYDTLGNLSGVSQGGYMPRNFTYDSLSRLLTATNPESGTITYTYDAAGNVITKKDARNITTTYTYDVLHRLLAKSYSDGTPTASFVYDICPAGGCPAGVTPALTTGRMVEASTANAKSFYSYDAVGRIKNLWECAPVNCAGNTYWALTSIYDLSGDVTSESNGLGVTLSSAYDTAARLTGVTSNLVDATHPANLLSGIQYNGAGLPWAETTGNQVSETFGYDSRLRMISLTATSPTAIGATPGQGTVTINGTENSHPNPAVASTASVTISGTEHSYVQCTRNFGCLNIYDSGKVFITVNGHEYDYNFSGNDNSQDTASTVAAGLVAAIQADGSRLVNASCSDGACSTPTITLTAVTAGSAGNSIAFTTGYTYSSQIARFASAGPSFTASPASGSLTGGADASTTYDSGTVTVTVNGVPTSVTYGNASSAGSVATALAQGLSQGSLVNATASGGVISITSRTFGASTNYTLAVSSNSSNGFSPPSFSGSTSGATLTGGSGATSGTVYSLALGYAPNGNVLTANDSVNGNWTYGYDDFNRLLSSNKNSGQQTYSYVYDRFGNRWQQNAPQGGSVSLATFTAGNNRVDGAGYDAASNMTHDPTTGANYIYDAENRIISVNSGAVTYAYNAGGQRVEKNVGGVKTDYVYDLGGRAIAEINGSGSVIREELFAGGKHLGTYTNNATYFSHGDGLGTERVRSDMTGAACETIQSLPYGDGQSTSGNCGDPSTRHFTGKERDTETGLDYFGARYYGSAFGTFTSADPRFFQGSMLIDPQRFNLYGYARDNPLRWIDPSGERLMLQGNVGWLLSNVLYTMAGGQAEFEKYFHLDHGEVVLNAGVNPLELNSGARLIYDMVSSPLIFEYFAGTNGEDAARLFKGTTKSNDKLNQSGKDLRDRFTCHLGGCGTLVGTTGRPLANQPADLATGDSVFMVIAYNEQTVTTQTGTGNVDPNSPVGQASAAGVGKTVLPVSTFIHESAENYAWAKLVPSWSYAAAHGLAQIREADIRRDLNISGGFAGGFLNVTVPEPKK
jgi:RHS repeat-associated protein